MSDSRRHMADQGYLIVLKPDINLAQYESSPHVEGWLKKNRKGYESYRDAFKNFGLNKYRGISREPLEAYISLRARDIDEMRRHGVDVDSNREARLRLTDIVPVTTIDYYDDSLITKYDDLLEIHGMLDEPQHWEVIRIRQNEFIEHPDTLGFDIGYWGGDHFSLIGDTIVMPMWHPVNPEDYAEVAERLSILNDNLLFDKYSQAKQ